MAINPKNDNKSHFADMASSSSFFDGVAFLLSSWSKCHINIITGSWVTTMFVSRRLTKNLEIGNTTVWVLSHIWRLGWVRNAKFDTNVSNETLLNTAKCQGYIGVTWDAASDWFLSKPNVDPPCQEKKNCQIWVYLGASQSFVSMTYIHALINVRVNRDRYIVKDSLSEKLSCQQNFYHQEKGSLATMSMHMQNFKQISKILC